MEVTGTLTGHLYFGVLFAAWAIVWIVEELARPVHGPAPLERGRILPGLKIVLPLGAIWFELPNRGWDPDDFMMGWAHIAAYFPFVISGAVDLLAHRGALGARAGFIAYALAHWNAAFVFWGHDNHGGVPAAAHLLLVLALSTAGAFGVFEYLKPGRLVAWFRRATLLGAGTWLCMLTWVLYLSEWDMADPIRESWVYVLFSWNAIALAVLVGPVAWLGFRRDDTR